MEGDGCKTARGWSYGTVSPSLAQDVQLLASTLGYRAGITKRPAHLGKINGHEINCQVSYAVQVNARVPGPNTIGRFKIRPSRHGVGVRVRKISQEYYSGQVFNLDVAYEHSYVASGRVVHNCMKFLADAQNYIPMELILDAESEEASKDIYSAQFSCANPDLFLGMDIGRKRDLTVIWVMERVADLLITRGVWELAKVPMQAQQDTVDMIFQTWDIQRGCFDCSGIGIQIAEFMEKKYGARAEAVTFTQQVKESLAPRTKKLFEDHKLRIPANDPNIRSDIHSIKKSITLAGNIRFDAPRSDKGHGDRHWSLALSCHAAETSVYQPLSDGFLAVQPSQIDYGQFPGGTQESYNALYGTSGKTRFMQ